MKLNSSVKLISTDPKYDGKCGVVGWIGKNMNVAIVIFETPFDNGNTAMPWPMTKLKEIVPDTANEKLSTKLDEDGYTIWKGDAFRPMHVDTIVRIKVRGNIPRDPVRAGAWPQICWMHRHKDDDMSRWDIIAYKEVK